MTEMVERVARAVCWNAASHPDPTVRAEFVERHWRDHMGGARVAILAMREPTEEMRHAYPAFTPGGRFATKEDAYTAMIDAALGLSL